MRPNRPGFQHNLEEQIENRRCASCSGTSVVLMGSRDNLVRQHKAATTVASSNFLFQPDLPLSHHPVPSVRASHEYHVINMDGAVLSSSVGPIIT